MIAHNCSVQFTKEHILGAKERPPVPTPCGHCQKPTTKRCGGCYMLYFCSRECQKKLWKAHKKECKQFQHVLRADEEMKEMQSGTNIFQKHMNKYPLKLNTTFQSKVEFLAWRQDRTEVFRRADHLKHIFFWLKDTYEPKNYTIELKLGVRSMEDFLQVNQQALANPKRIFLLQYDFRHPWCIMLANMKAAQGTVSWQQNAASMAGGWHMIVGDNYAEGPLSASDAVIKEKMITFKMSMAKAIGQVGKFESCSICFDTLVSEVRLPCDVCRNEICVDCQRKIIVDGVYKCPFCRNVV